MKRFDAPRAAGLAAALVVAANAVVLGTTWWNRSGEPEASIEVTEREIAMPLGRDKEDTGLLLTLVLADRPPAEVERMTWWTSRRLPTFEHAWLDPAKLRGLGFDLAALESAARDARKDGGRETRATRRAFVVVEYDGEAWRAWLAAREAEVAKLRDDVAAGAADRGKLADAEALLAIDRTSRSRLMPIDAGIDAAPLRAAHPDRDRCAVVPAVVGVRASAGEDGTATLRGVIEGLAVRAVSVPKPWLAPLMPFVPQADEVEVNRRLREDALASKWPAPAPPRYRGTLAYGRNFDPWLTGVAVTASIER